MALGVGLHRRYLQFESYDGLCNPFSGAAGKFSISVESREVPVPEEQLIPNSVRRYGMKEDGWDPCATAPSVKALMVRAFDSLLLCGGAHDTLSTAGTSFFP